MQKKSLTTLLGLIIVLVLVFGGYALFHKTPKKTPASTPATSNTGSTTNSGSAVNNSLLVTKSNSSLGQYLAMPNGTSLYTYSGDESGVSNCAGTCLSSWPPYVDSGATTGLPTNVGVIKRSDDNKYQYTYKGMPLYQFVGDTAPGQVSGNGVSGFAVAKP